MNVPVENGELSGNDHLGREGSGIAFCGGNVDFFPYIDEITKPPLILPLIEK